MALGMAAAVSEPRCPSAPGPAAGQVQAQPPPELTAAPSPPSFPPSLPAAALAGGGAATRGCALRPPGEPTPRSNNTMSAGRVRTKKKACSSEQSPDSLPLRSSGRQVKKKAAEATDDDDDASEKKYRKCEKAGCTATCPVCFASAAERCAKNGYTSRWYHLSCGEHFCNECFDHYYRSHKDGYEKYTAWKRIWTSNGKSEPSPKAFMADQQLPYWVQCTKPECGKWRQLTKEIQLTPQIAKTYKCGMKLNNSTKVTQKTFAHMETSNK